MKNKDLLIILGILVIIAGIITQIYTIKTTSSYAGGFVERESTKKPYQQYAIPLILAGLILIIVGAMIPEKHK
ncbi:MAG: hypothetical protein ACOYT4_03210 [Nanoarchaeota archaeon]